MGGSEPSTHSLPEGIREAIEEFRENLRRAFGNRLVRLILFGSYARGIVHEESDVDVLVLVEPGEPGDGHRAVEAAPEVMLRRPEALLSPMVLTPGELDALRARERRLALDIDREGITL